MWKLDYKESWAPKNWCFWTVVLEKTLESPLDCTIKPVNPKGDQPWIFIGRTDAEAEVSQYFGHLIWRTNSLEKILILGKIEGKRKRRWQRMRRLNGVTDQQTWVSKLWEKMKDRKGWCAWGHTQTRLSDWTTTTTAMCCPHEMSKTQGD